MRPLRGRGVAEQVLRHPHASTLVLQEILSSKRHLAATSVRRAIASHPKAPRAEALRCLDDLHAMLKAHGDWMPLGGADEQKAAPQGSVEAWGRSADNPVGGWYGLKKGLRGRFGMYVPPLMEALAWPRWSTTPRTTACGRYSPKQKHYRR